MKSNKERAKMYYYNHREEILKKAKKQRLKLKKEGKKFNRVCPCCDKLLLYNWEYTRNLAEKKGVECRSCSSVKKNKKIWNLELREKRAKKMKGNTFNKGRKLNKKWKENISKSLLGNDYRKGKPTKQSTRNKQSISNKGRKVSEKTKRKQRESRLKLIQEKGGVLHNPKACEYLNKLNEERGWNLQHAENGGEIDCIGYSLDGYDKEKNIVVEYDEKHHYDISGNLRKQDIKRMNEIKQHLNCEFFRYNEDTNKLIKYEFNSVIL